MLHKNILLSFFAISVICSAWFSLHFFNYIEQKAVALALIKNQQVPAHQILEAVKQEGELSEKTIVSLQKTYRKGETQIFTEKDHYLLHYTFDNCIRRNALGAVNTTLIALLSISFAYIRKKFTLKFLCSCLLLISLGVSWSIFTLYPPAVKEKPLFRTEELTEALSSLQQETNTQEPELIHSRFFIKTVQHLNRRQAVIKGYLGQIHPRNIPLSPRDMWFPGSEGFEMKKVFNMFMLNQREFSQYMFQVYYNKEFSHRYFPFAPNKLWLNLRYKDPEKNIVFVPDTRSFETRASLKLGIDTEELVLEDMEIVQSFYSLGNSESAGKEVTNAQMPDVRLNILTKSDKSSVILPLSILFLLFVILVVVAYPLHHDNALSTLIACIIVFILTVVAHALLHAQLYSRTIVPFESYYLLLYANLITFSLITYLHSFKKLPKFRLIKIQSRYKSYFLPVNLAFIYVITTLILF